MHIAPDGAKCDSNEKRALLGHRAVSRGVSLRTLLEAVHSGLAIRELRDVFAQVSPSAGLASNFAVVRARVRVIRGSLNCLPRDAHPQREESSSLADLHS